MKLKKNKPNILQSLMMNCKLKQFLAVVLILISIVITAQTPTLIASGTYKASGAGASGIPTINFNIPAGKNRVMIISAFYERVHSPYSSNFLTVADGSAGNTDSFPRPSVNGITSVYLDGNMFWSNSGPNDTNVFFTSGNSVRYISDAMGLPTGNYAVTFPIINLPENSGDEMMVNIEVFENAKQVPVAVTFNSIRDFTTSSNFLTLNGTAQAIPVGNAINNTIYLGSGGTTQGKQVNFSTGWTVVNQDFVTNSSGTSLYSGSLNPNEHDGITLATAYRTITTGNPSFSVSRAATNPSTHAGAFSMIAILPLARPSVAGTVYIDNNGLTGGINGGGTGGGVWNTANSLWVNAVNSSGNVVATALVNTSGLFTFPTGSNLVEGDVITFQLSKNQGLIGQPAPAKELPVGWGTVGESINSGPSDGTPNGEFILTIGSTNSTSDTTNRFGVTSCSAGVTAPPVQNISIACPATFVNLNTAHTGTVPTGSSLVWYNNDTHSGTVLSGTQITQAVAGTYYYAFYYDSTNNCYSPVSTPVFVIGYSTVDSDGDGIPNACDLDSDNDGILDTNENVNCSTNISTTTDPNPTASVTASGSTIQYTESGANVTPIAGSGVGFTGLEPRQGATITYDFSVPVNNLKMWYADLDNREYLKINYYDENNTRITNLTSYVTNNVGAVKTITSDSSFGLLIDPTTEIIPGQAPLAQYVEVTTPFKVKKLEVTFNALRADGTAYPATNMTPDIYMKSLCVYGDTDGDGIPDYLDLDSDADGCSDAIEGGANITTSQLVIAAGTVSGGSTSVNQNLCALTTCVNSSGLPQFTTLPTGYSNTTGQTIGSSQDNSINSCFCYKPAVLDAGNTYPTKHGITALGRAGAENENWPMVRESAWTVLESKEKGFVVNRVTTTAGLANITNPVEGMMVYDEQADCLKIYTLKTGDSAMAWHCFTTPACPD